VRTIRASSLSLFAAERLPANSLGMKISRLALGAYGIALAVIILDQLTKAWVLGAIDAAHISNIPDGYRIAEVMPPIFNLTYVLNTGVSFGLFGGGALHLGLGLQTHLLLGVLFEGQDGVGHVADLVATANRGNGDVQIPARQTDHGARRLSRLFRHGPVSLDLQHRRQRHHRRRRAADPGQLPVRAPFDSWRGPRKVVITPP